MDRLNDFQFRTGFQVLADICNANNIPARFCLLDGGRFCAVINDKIVVYRDGDGVKIDCPKSSLHDRELVNRVASTVKMLANRGYAFPA